VRAVGTLSPGNLGVFVIGGGRGGGGGERRGACPCREVGACAPLTESRGGGGGTSAWGGCGSAHR
jgi:hypothetical protein